MEYLTDKQDVENLIRSVAVDQRRMQETEDPEVFRCIKNEFERLLVHAKARLAQHEEMATLWRGLELNLTMFQSQIQSAEARIQQARRSITCIEDLVRHVDNEAQKVSLNKLRRSHPDEQMYLAAYEAAPVGRGDAEGTFTVLGCMRKGARESYSVKWYRLASQKPSFWCNCPDHKFNSTKKNIVCKHICFLVAKVGRILDPAFFESKRFTPEQHAAFATVIRDAAVFADGSRERARMTAAEHLARDAALVAAMSRDTARSLFEEPRKPVAAEDMCPICYDGMTDTANLSCPTCSNNVHRECMEVWLERNLSCVFCRSGVWRRWIA